MSSLSKTGLLVFLFLITLNSNGQVDFKIYQPRIPVLTEKDHNPVLKIIPQGSASGQTLEEVKITLEGTSDLNDIENVSLFYSADSVVFVTDKQVGEVSVSQPEISFHDHIVIPKKGFFWVSVKLKDKIDLLHKIKVSCNRIVTSKGTALLGTSSPVCLLRVGIALRKHNDDGVHTYRIPGLTTTTKGTLLAVYDVRRESSRDLQGNIDIGLSRSTDGGSSWEPMKIVLDKSTWGNLPEKFNGVSDPCILVDENTGNIFVAALWMYGVMDNNGKWIEGLNENSTVWNHQWREKGSQPGFEVKETSQFLITKSKDDGITWSFPKNLTKDCKKKEWWLFAPAPGHGITLDDGTLVFPSQGRDANGTSFSNLMFSRNHGRTWKVSNPPGFDTTESMAVQLENGAVMLNIRDNRNRKDTTSTNGRAIHVTNDLGKSWQMHSTSHGALIEPTCMAAIHKHVYSEKGIKKSMLLFSNPSSKKIRQNITIKVSFDNGLSWPAQYWMLLDEYKGRGYSCITSIDEKTIGILYESSQADLVFQKIPLDELIKPSGN